MYKREQVSAAIYLVKTKDEMLETVVSQQMKQPRKYPSVLSEATKVLGWRLKSARNPLNATS